MTPEIAQNALQFLMRVDLKGAEVPAFNAVANELSIIAQSESKAVKVPGEIVEGLKNA